jgi:magnesium-transporting ATPase (P-type)
MVTGDNQATAEALADDLDIALDRVIAGMLNLLSSSSSTIMQHSIIYRFLF